jgi:hypothetical protein
MNFVPTPGVDPDPMLVRLLGELEERLVVPEECIDHAGLQGSSVDLRIPDSRYPTLRESARVAGGVLAAFAVAALAVVSVDTDGSDVDTLEHDTEPSAFTIHVGPHVDPGIYINRSDIDPVEIPSQRAPEPDISVAPPVVAFPNEDIDRVPATPGDQFWLPPAYTPGPR